jgi:hypothetical protein
MNTNAVYSQNEAKGLGILKKFWRIEEGQYENVVPENVILLKTIQSARQDWLNAVANFEQAENDELIDYYIYRMKACQIRYNYLLKQAKAMGIRGDIEPLSF